MFGSQQALGGGQGGHGDKALHIGTIDKIGIQLCLLLFGQGQDDFHSDTAVGRNTQNAVTETVQQLVNIQRGGGTVSVHISVLFQRGLPQHMIHQKLGIRLRPGLTECLIRRYEPEDVITVCGREGEAFCVIPAGQIPPNPMELLSSGRMTGLLQTLREEYDEILLDLPPVGEVSDALMTAKFADGLVLVARCGYCRSRNLKNALDRFRSVDARVLGVLANCARPPKKTRKALRRQK